MIAATVRYSAVLASGAPHATYLASLDSAGAGQGVATLLATVSTALLDSWDGEGVAYRYRILLGGVEIPASDLVGGLELSDSMESPLNRAKFSIRGAARSVFATLTTWSKTEVEIYVDHGQAWLGEQAMREELAFRGVVLTPTSQSADVEPALEINCAGRIVLFDQLDLCYELPPYSGLTRGAIIADALLGAGITLTDIPPGAVFDKPVFTDRMRPLVWLREFGEPEGWRFRMRAADDTLESYPDAIKQSPQPPDHQWHAAECEAVSVETPQEPPSRYIFRGMGAIRISEAGYQITINRYVAQGLYSPRVAVQKQLTDGTVVSTGVVNGEPTLIVVGEILDQVARRGNLIVSQETVEYRWYNPPAAYKVTADGTGPADGYDWLEVLIDDNGDYVTWPAERFVEVGRRSRHISYNDAGTIVGETTQENRWFPYTEAAVRETSPDDPGTGDWFDNVYVGGDDRSYSSRQTHSYGYAERRDRVFTYDGTTGAMASEEERRFGWYGRRAAVDMTGHYETADGAAMAEQYATFQEISITRKVNLIQNGHLRGTVTEVSGFMTPQAANGSHNWGSFRSNSIVERFQIVKSENTTYTQLDGLYEETTYDGTAPPVTKTYSGNVPMPRYTASAWTHLTQEPLELIENDEAAELLWGFQREVLNSDYLQSMDEAQAMIDRRRFHNLARQITVRRPVTAAREGDTVLMIDPRQGIYHRCLVAKRDRQFTGSAAIGTYLLEADFP